MISSDFRTEARKKLAGKWRKVLAVSFIYFLICFVIGLIENNVSNSTKSLISLIGYIIEIPLLFGMTMYFFKLYNSEECKFSNYFNFSFSNFARAWYITLRILLKLIIPIVLLVIAFILQGFATFAFVASAIYNQGYSGFVILSVISLILIISSSIWLIAKSYYYNIAFIIAIDNPDLSPKDVVDHSQELMTGKRSKLFLLHLSFIGWSILACITLGIGILWLVPYVKFSTIAFYKNLKDEKNTEKIENDKKAELDN